MSQKVEIILSGGLGNQLFQYSFGRWLSQKRKCDLVLNTSRLNLKIKNETPRSFALSDYKIDAEVISDSRIPGKSRLVDFVFRKVNFFDYSYEDSDLNASTFWGHWLDMKYADEIRQKFLYEISLKTTLSSHDQVWFDVCNSKSILSIHVRRGDYVANIKTANHHGILGKAYYERAIALAHKNMKVEEVWIFTDDPKWSSANFPNAKIIKLESSNPAVDLALMSVCKGNIISNSTFSWWAAWMNQNSEKVVIMPTNWFQKAKNPSLYPNNWLKLENG